ncbi:MAG TPA: CDP-alcohol phosphatidyltransferase family protein [Pseudonocardia sp.]|nr:CDP-alcohol phosphatidyltransferase family protein [Pseudonocardia sp.]
MTTVAPSRADRQQATAVVAQIVVLVVVSATVGLGIAGWCAGLAYTGGLWMLLRGAVRRHGVSTLGPAGLVTSARGVLIGAVTALVAAGLAAGPAGPTGNAGPAVGLAHGTVVLLVCLATAALVLDAVDGRVARRTGTASPLGARFDMELDAWLIAVLSVHVAGLLGVWVLAIGGMRYAFVALAAAVPWMRSTVPARDSARVVAAVQGIVLVTAASGVLPRIPVVVLVATALVALGWSFSRDVRWLWVARAGEGPDVGPDVGPNPVTTALAGLLVFVALLVPATAGEVHPAAFLRIPVEALVGVVVALLLPARALRPVALGGGLALGLLTVLKVANAGFMLALARPFHPLTDWALLDDAVGFLRTSIGPLSAVLTVIAAVAALTAVVALIGLAALRLARFVVARRRAATRIVAVLAPVWLVCAVAGAHLVPGIPIASGSTAALAYRLGVQARADARDRAEFATQVGAGAPRDAAATADLAGLRGKDVVLVFLESYGRSAVEDPTFAPRVDAVLDEGTRRLGAAGFGARSGWLTSSTSGGGSWLAHSTLLTGLWIDSQQRFHEVVKSDRLTLNRAFQRGGWRTVGVMPAWTTDWPEEPFYGYDQVYDSRHLGYRGPGFSFAPVPDQFTLNSFERLERSRTDRPPLMAQIVLVSSHAPWTPLPHMVGWNELGDGSVFDPMAGHNYPTDVILTRNPAGVRTDYRRSIEYTLNSLIAYVQRYGDDRTVLVFLGDHQPAPVVVGPDASRDVPITIVAKDPAVLDRIAGWGWQDGLKPAPNSPVWRMDTFRDRFMAAFGSTGAPGGSTAGPPGPAAAATPARPAAAPHR